jgi:hypothetical protein
VSSSFIGFDAIWYGSKFQEPTQEAMKVGKLLALVLFKYK